MGAAQRIKIVIYDCDGVLFDSRGANEAFYNHILTHFNMPAMNLKQLEFVHSSTAREALDFLFQASPLREEAQKYRYEVDYSQFVYLMKPEPYLREVLQRLHPTYRTAIATNRGHTTPLVLQNHNLGGLFDMVVTSMDVTESKPHPESIWKILHNFKLEPGEALYVGDSVVDETVCQRAGVSFAAYKNPTLKANHHLQNHYDLLGILGIDTEEESQDNISSHY